MRLYTRLFKWPYHIDLPALLSLTTVNFHCMTYAYYPQLFIFSSCSTLCCGATILAPALKAASPSTAASQSNQKPGQPPRATPVDLTLHVQRRSCHRHAQLPGRLATISPGYHSSQVRKKHACPHILPEDSRRIKKRRPWGAVFASWKPARIFLRLISMRAVQRSGPWCNPSLPTLHQCAHPTAAKQ